jgi:hypothetical protein
MTTFKRFLKNFDLFGHQVHLNFDKKGHQHNTLVGGFLSICLLTAMIWLLVLRIYEMAYEDETQIIQKSDFYSVDFNNFEPVNMTE